MGRVKIEFPFESLLFIAKISIRIGDINYGGHAGNDAILSIIHEARMQWLYSHGFTELNAGGNSLIMADVMIAYKGEAFYGDELIVKIYTAEISRSSFDLFYHISCVRNDASVDIAHAKTGMICFDYEKRKITVMQEQLENLLKSYKTTI